MAGLSLLLLLTLANLVWCQQIYIPTTGAASRPQCTTTGILAQPVFRFGNFSYTLSETVRTATSVSPASTTSTFAPSSAQALGLLTSLSTRTWSSWNPNATTTATDTADPYGFAAWTALWQHASPPNFTTGVYSTTVNPTPIPTSELILPPPDYFGPTDCYNFPEGFVFGVSSSAAQIEGAVAEQGKSPSLMEILIQDAARGATDYTTNEVYYLYKQDIERVAAMGVKYFSFSIAWTRILPFALPGTPVNQQGIDHYNDVVNFILSKGMIPVVTLLHFDTPLQFYGSNLSVAADQPLIGYVNGGYQNETFIDAFYNYAQIVMSHYADRVPIWFTFNEPLLYSYNGVSVNNVVKSHAKVYHWYKEVLKGSGRIALKFNDNFGVPRNISSTADLYAANHFNEFQLGTFCNPIYLGIDYPDAFKQTIPDYVPLTTQDLAYIGGTADFLGIDPYTATVVTPPRPGDISSISECAMNRSNPYFPYCVNQTTVNQYGWNIGYRSQSYVYITPTYLREYLVYLYNTWKHPVMITEFGFPVYGEADKDLTDQLYDTPRSIYYLSYMSEVLKAIWEDGVDVIGALAWSYADNWEFGDYSAHFGLQTVNRTSQERRYKKSFFDLVDFVAARTRK